MIVYWAQLHGYGMSLNWSSRLVCHGDLVTTRASLARVKPPTMADKIVSWSHARLGVRGTWSAQQQELTRTLLKTPAGNLTWSCLTPRAEVSVQVDDRMVHGLGYVEQLSMTIQPWKLPIDQLRWGRFLAEDSDVIWIQWLGSQPLTLLLLNGHEVAATSISDRLVQWDGGTLDLADSMIFRDGQLGPTVLNAIPGIQRILPAAMMATHETKWRSSGTLQLTGQQPRHGWAIHELVTLRGTAT